MTELKRNLIICNTYMQLITAIQMKMSLLNDEAADLILSDSSVNAYKAAERVATYKLFDRVTVINAKDIIYNQSKLADVMDVIRLTLNFGSKFKKQIWENAAYDRIFYCNFDPFVLCAYDQSVRLGKKPTCARFEEGILSYRSMTEALGARMTLTRRLRNILHRDSVVDQTKNYYCYYPELFPVGFGEVHKILLLSRDNQQLISILNSIFAYAPEIDRYPQKYIFFASSSDIDGKKVGETELILQVAEAVGKENLLVKMHPRDGRHVYEEYGITVSRNSSIPWEVIQLNHCFDNHVFLTMSSGSVLNASAMLGDSIPTYFLYPLVLGRNSSLDAFYRDSIEPTLRAMNKNGMLTCVKEIGSDQRIGNI